MRRELIKSETIYLPELKKHYCIYCASEAKSNSYIEDYEEYESHYCNCDNAKIEIQANELLKSIKIDEKSKKKLNKLKYDNEVIACKHKYGVISLE